MRLLVRVSDVYFGRLLLRAKGDMVRQDQIVFSARLSTVSQGTYHGPDDVDSVCWRPVV